MLAAGEILQIVACFERGFDAVQRGVAGLAQAQRGYGDAFAVAVLQQQDVVGLAAFRLVGGVLAFVGIAGIKGDAEAAVAAFDAGFGRNGAGIALGGG